MKKNTPTFQHDTLQLKHTHAPITTTEHTQSTHKNEYQKSDEINKWTIFKTVKLMQGIYWPQLKVFRFFLTWTQRSCHRSTLVNRSAFPCAPPRTDNHCPRSNPSNHWFDSSTRHAGWERSTLKIVIKIDSFFYLRK